MLVTSVDTHTKPFILKIDQYFPWAPQDGKRPLRCRRGRSMQRSSPWRALPVLPWTQGHAALGSPGCGAPRAPSAAPHRGLPGSWDLRGPFCLLVLEIQSGLPAASGRHRPRAHIACDPPQCSRHPQPGSRTHGGQLSLDVPALPSRQSDRE